MMCLKIGKIDAAHITANTSVVSLNIEPPIAELDSALKTGLDTMLWRCIIVISSCYAPYLSRRCHVGGVVCVGKKKFA